MKKEQAEALYEAKENLAGAKFNSVNFPKIAASRAYYAMFYVAKVFLLEKDLDYSKHSAVLSAFGAHFAKTGIVPAEYHRYLTEAQAFRHHADYAMVRALPADVVRLQIERAEDFIKLAEQIFGTVSEADKEDFE